MLPPGKRRLVQNKYYEKTKREEEFQSKPYKKEMIEENMDIVPQNVGELLGNASNWWRVIKDVQRIEEKRKVADTEGGLINRSSQKRLCVLFAF